MTQTSKPTWGHQLRSVLSPRNLPWENEDMYGEGTMITTKPWNGHWWRIDINLVSRDQWAYGDDSDEDEDWITISSCPVNTGYENLPPYPSNDHCFAFDPGSSERIACVNAVQPKQQQWSHVYESLWASTHRITSDLNDWIEHREWLKQKLKKAAANPAAYATIEIL